MLTLHPRTDAKESRGVVATADNATLRGSHYRRARWRDLTVRPKSCSKCGRNAARHAHSAKTNWLICPTVSQRFHAGARCIERVSWVMSLEQSAGGQRRHALMLAMAK
jgi:hypothetical protein